MIQSYFDSAKVAGRMPAWRGSLCSCAVLLAWMQSAAATDAIAVQPDAAGGIAIRVVALADKEKLDAIEPLLRSLEHDHPATDARYAATLYAAQRALATDHRPQAQAWLARLNAKPSPHFRDDIAAAVACCTIDPADLSVPTARLLELADAPEPSPFAAAALELRARKLVAAQRVDEAIFVYHGLLGRFPDSRSAAANILAVARLHHELGQQREAIQWLTLLIDDYTTGLQVDAGLYLGAVITKETRNKELQTKWLTQLVADYPQSGFWSDGAFRLAELQMASGDNIAADNILIALLARSDLPASLRERSLLLRVQGEVAEKAWMEVEERTQEMLAAHLSEETKRLALFWQAEAAYRRGERELAFTRFADLSLAIEGRHDDWLGTVPLRLAQMEAQRQRWSAALELADALVKDHPKFSRMYEVDYLRGRCLAAQGRFSAAREALYQASESKPESETAAMAQWMIGETYFLQKRYDNALAAYNKTRTCGFAVWQAAGLLQAGKCCEQLSRWDDATAHYNELLHDFPATRYVVDAKVRLEKVHERSSVAAQPVSSTATR